MTRRAMVLAAGLGQRMRPITDHTPKPLVPVLGTPMLARAIRLLSEAGIDEIVVNAHHLADQIADFVAAQPPSGPKLFLRREPVLLETGGGVVNALDLLGAAPFVVVNADTLWFDAPEAKAGAVARLCASYDPARMDALLLTHPMATAVGYRGDGDLDRAADGRLRFRSPGETVPYAFAGISITCAASLAGRRPEPFSMSEVWRASAAAGRLHGLVHDGLWLHVGTPEDLAVAEAFLRDRGLQP